MLLAAWLTDASPVRVYSSEVAPPAQGLAGIGLSLMGVVVLGVAAVTVIRRRRTNLPRPVEC